MIALALALAALQAAPAAPPPAVVSADARGLAAQEPANEGALNDMGARYLATSFDVRLASGRLVCHPSGPFGSPKLTVETCLAAEDCLGRTDDLGACVNGRKAELLDAYKKEWREAHPR